MIIPLLDTAQDFFHFSREILEKLTRRPSKWTNDVFFALNHGYMWLELKLCSEGFFPGNPGFSLSLKNNYLFDL